MKLGVYAVIAVVGLAAGLPGLPSVSRADPASFG